VNRFLPAILVVILGLALQLAACTGSLPTPKDLGKGAQTVALDAKAALPQIAGIAKSAAIIIANSPEGSTDGGKAAVGWANSVTTLAEGMQQGLDSKDQLAGAYTALRNTVNTLPLDTASKASLATYLGWGDVAAQVLDLAVTVIKGATSANPTSWLLARVSGGASGKEACSSCHSLATASFGLTSHRIRWV
jgi:hypothetical protein